MAIHPAVAPYVPLVAYIGQVFGKDCEVVLHDLTSFDHSIVAIANGHLSGRKVGDTLTDQGRKNVSNPHWNDLPFVANYVAKTLSKDCTVRASTFFIRDEDHTMVGLLCCNFDISNLLSTQELITRLMGVSASTPVLAVEGIPGPVQSPTQKDWFASTVEDSLARAITDALADYCVPGSRLSTEEKREVVEQLCGQGVFNRKGAVPMVAAQLSVSEQTVYRYLREVQSNFKHG